MYRRLSAVGASLPLKEGKVLSVSGSSGLAGVMGIRAASLTEADYPEQNMLSLKFPDDSFDFVLSDQVLEHVAGQPQKAFDECRRVLRPGGIAVHTTCFINPVHGAPGDYWRFTPEALRLMAKDFSEIIECGGWGNFEAWSLIRNGLRFEGIPEVPWHPLNRIAVKNDPLWPIVVWIVARK